MLSVIINFFMFSPWLIWNSFFLYFILKYNERFNYIILTKKQLVTYWIYILMLFSCISYIFLIRLSNINRNINILVIWETFCDLLNSLPIVAIFIFFICALWVITSSFLVLKIIYLYLRKCLLALFLYYFQYQKFRNCCYKYVSLSVDFLFYLIRRVKNFTANPSILLIAQYIWPGFLTFLEPKIFISLVPYLFIFDFITQDGHISKIFIVLPWFYIYTLIRLSRAFFRKIYTSENTDFSDSVYKSMTINGKTIRWVQTP